MRKLGRDLLQSTIVVAAILLTLALLAHGCMMRYQVGPHGFVVDRWTGEACATTRCWDHGRQIVPGEAVEPDPLQRLRSRVKAQR